MKTRIQLLTSVFLIVLVLNSREASAQLFWDQACSFNGTGTSYIAVKHSSRLNLTGSFNS